jgi:hypothetical protein
VVEAWKNDAGDRMLTDLMPFLEAIARQQPPDVRDVVASYTYAPFAARSARVCTTRADHAVACVFELSVSVERTRGDVVD